VRAECRRIQSPAAQQRRAERLVDEGVPGPLIPASFRPIGTMKGRQGSCSVLQSALADRVQSWSCTQAHRKRSRPCGVEYERSAPMELWRPDDAGRAEEAVRIYVALLEEDPDNTALLDLTAELLADLGFDK